MRRQPSDGCFQIGIRRSILAEGVSRYIQSTQCSNIGQLCQTPTWLWCTEIFSAKFYPCFLSSTPIAEWSDRRESMLDFMGSNPVNIVEIFNLIRRSAFLPHNGLLHCVAFNCSFSLCKVFFVLL